MDLIEMHSEISNQRTEQLTLLKRLNIPKNIAISKHAKMRLTERSIMVADIIKGIDTGEIIEQYKDDKPLPSYLILGHAVNDNYIHIVLSTDNKYIYLITAYYPTCEHWESDFKTRKGC